MVYALRRGSILGKGESMAVVKIIELVGSSTIELRRRCPAGARRGPEDASQHQGGRRRVDRPARRLARRVARARAGRLPRRERRLRQGGTARSLRPRRRTTRASPPPAGTGSPGPGCRRCNGASPSVSLDRRRRCAAAGSAARWSARSEPIVPFSVTSATPVMSSRARIAQTRHSVCTSDGVWHCSGANPTCLTLTGARHWSASWALEIVAMVVCCRRGHAVRP